MGALDILHSEGSDSIVLGDPNTHDDIAEVFHCERHTVTQTPEQAMVIASRFAASGALYDALTDMLAGWRYIRQVHGDLSGVGWDRAEDAATKALRLARGEKVS